MKYEIKNRWTGATIYADEAESFRALVEAAVRAKASLRYASLRYADLRYADLRYADLRYADLRSASLNYADLRYADLRYASLRSADLNYADLRSAEEDFCKVLDSAPNEVAGLRKAMVAGTIDGSHYSGECACLVGTIAKVRKCDVNTLDKNSSRPAERWFLMFRPGDTPKNHAAMKITLGWLDKWAKKHKKVPA